MTIKLTFDWLDREDVRLIAAALRDKREQMLATARKMGASESDPDNEAGKQAHRMAGLIEQVRRVYEQAPFPKVSGEYID